MSTIQANNAKIFYQSVGDGPETILFSHGYLADHTMFEPQIKALKADFRCVTYDHRGHGQSEVTKGGYELDNLVTDAISLIETLEIGPVHFVGVSVGGFVGMRIALRRPDLLRSLTLVDTSAEAEPEQAAKMNKLLLWMVKYLGWGPVIGQALPIMFSKNFLEDKGRDKEVEKWKKIFTGHDRKGIIPFGHGIFFRESILDQLASLSLPTAVIVGEEDASSPPEYSQRMAEIIPNAKMVTVPGAGHYAVIEKPAAVIEAMQDFYRNAGIS